jgi:hypothetical protein
MTCGCSKPAARATIYPVTGKITFLGNPVVGATVSFSPQGKQPAAVGRTNESGEFKLRTYAVDDGAAAGDYNVAVLLLDSGPATPNPSDSHFAGGKTPGSASHSAPKDKSSKTGTVLPAKYGSPVDTPLRATVDPAKLQPFTFDIK